jgi:hypothetical protein
MVEDRERPDKPEFRSWGEPLSGLCAKERNKHKIE